MSVDTKQALRPVLSLANPSALQGARWGEARLDTKQALRLVLSLANPSELRPQEVPVGYGAQLIRTDTSKNIFHKPKHQRASQTQSASGTAPTLVFECPGYSCSSDAVRAFVAGTFEPAEFFTSTTG